MLLNLQKNIQQAKYVKTVIGALMLLAIDVATKEIAVCTTLYNLVGKRGCSWGKLLHVKRHCGFCSCDIVSEETFTYVFDIMKAEVNGNSLLLNILFTNHPTWENEGEWSLISRGLYEALIQCLLVTNVFTLPFYGYWELPATSFLCLCFTHCSLLIEAMGS